MRTPFVLLNRRAKNLRRTAIGLLGCLVACVVVIVSACSGESSSSSGGGEADCTADLASIQQNVFRTSCVTAGCHSGTAPAADLDLTGETEQRLVGVSSSLCKGATRVVAGRPGDSLLYQKIAGVQTCGAPMPIGASLSAKQRLCIEDWIYGLPVSDAGADACTTC